MDEATLRQSPLAAEHARLAARMVPFAGWSMPVQFAGILAEHRAVREKAGVFDISHMGQVEVAGPAAASGLEGLLTNRIAKLGLGQGQYTLMLNGLGGVIDDLIAYRTGQTEYFLVVNASRREEDVAWLTRHLPGTGVAVADRSAQFGGLAVQGPEAAQVFAAMTGDVGPGLPPRFGITGEVGKGVWVCRTGYTGEDGFELFAPVAAMPDWWRRALSAGAAPCGLGARDSLRLEKCYPLNGSDLSYECSPLEAGLGSFVDLDKGDFIGRAVLLRQKEEGLTRRLVALRVTGQKAPPPRAGYAVFRGAEPAGTLTSGGLSPGLGCGIGMAYLGKDAWPVGTRLELDVRGKRFPVEVVKKPFV
jgi:aminomethyltransferase